MRWFKGFLAVMALALSLAANAMPASVAAREAAPEVAAVAPGISVSPVSGDQNQVFTFAGQGFAVGARLTVSMTGPDGSTFGLMYEGQPGVWQVSDTGAFVIEILPSRDFAGAPAGAWQAKFRVEGTADCWSGSFDISV